mmetsp:Transcript_43519/g.112418  ORF Transcript_43519/g.112418 Transcript_43519/m.112418 type:complete len:134 (+) Transcript_43519:252-653(+)
MPRRRKASAAALGRPRRSSAQDTSRSRSGGATYSDPSNCGTCGGENAPQVMLPSSSPGIPSSHAFSNTNFGGSSSSVRRKLDLTPEASSKDFIHFAEYQADPWDSRGFEDRGSAYDDFVGSAVHQTQAVAERS